MNTRQTHSSEKSAKSMHAVTSQGFELKVALFVIASSLNGYLNL